MAKQMIHRLSEFDDSLRTALCAHCGPVKTKVWVSKGKTKRACMTRIKAEKDRYAQTHKHVTRDWQLRSKYGVSLNEYNRMMAEQGGLCAICFQPETQRRALSLDHHHPTGRRRRLLCFRCNTVLGLMDEDPKLFEAAVAYLRDHSEPVIT